MPAAESMTGPVVSTARRAVSDPTTADPALPVDGLSGYVEAVARALGLWPAGVHHEVTDTATAYIALAGHSPAEPGLDLMLVWSAGGGWSVATEPGRPAQAPAVPARLAGDVLPAPPVVAGFVARVLAGRTPDHPPRPRPGAPADRLTDYRRGPRSSVDGSRARFGRGGPGRHGAP